MLNMLSTT